MTTTEERMRVIGQPFSRIEGKEKVTGEIKYLADMTLPGMLHAKVLRSKVAHAKLLGIDASKALALPGVRAVVSAANLPEHADRDRNLRVQVPFAEGEIVFHGQPIAAVAADSLDIAEEALDLIEVHYEELPAVLDVEAAMTPGSPLTRQGARLDPSGLPNVSARLRFQRGEIAGGFAEADVIVEGRFDLPGVHQAYLEPLCAMAQYDPSGKLTIWSPTQGQFSNRADIARILGLSANDVRYISTEVGGGFGGKSPAITQPIVGLLSMQTHRPVRLIWTRKEDLAAAVPAPGGVIYAKIGTKNDGTLTAIEAKILFKAGAFPSGPVAAHTMMLAACYRFQTLSVDGYEVLTNQVSGWAYRAPGGPQIAFAIEQLIDESARRIGMDPISFRRINAVREGDLLPNGKPWPRIGLVECLDKLEKSELWQRHLRGETRPGRSVGVAAGGWLGAFQPASAIVRLNDDGSILVIVGANDISGTNTTFSAIAAEVLGVKFEMVNTRTADTDHAPFAGVSAGSKTTYSVGIAVKKAAEDARRQILDIAANEMQVDPEVLTIEDGIVRGIYDGSLERIPLPRIAAISTGMGGIFGPVLGTGAGSPRSQAPGFSAQAVELEVDRETGSITVTGVATVQDAGRALNRMSVLGQLEGGTVQGLGVGLTEELVFDAAGRLRNPSLLDYRLLTALDVPYMESSIVEVPSPEGPFGARIVGEPSIIPAAAAVANAVRDLTGKRIYQAPLSPERVAQ